VFRLSASQQQALEEAGGTVGQFRLLVARDLMPSEPLLRMGGQSEQQLSGATTCAPSGSPVGLAAEEAGVAGGRRPNGALERDVLACLWAAGRPMTATDVQESLDVDLAYTTVMTTLSRLDGKGIVRRLPSTGRPHHYVPSVSEDELIASRMMDLLGATEDRTAVLARFLGSLREDDRDVLRKALRRKSQP